MTENKRYYIGNGENCTICDSNEGGSDFYNMLTQFEAVDRLNEQEETINELKQRNQRQYDRLKELTELMYERQWEKLENMVNEWEKADELLEQEHGNCGDKE